MVSDCTDLSPAGMHELCMSQWPILTERLHTIPPWEWPDKLTPWLAELASAPDFEEKAAGDDVARLVGALALVNALGRLHRSRTGSVHDAFRGIRDELLKGIRQTLSPQEVFALLDAIEFEARTLEQAFLRNAD
jgi:hypothetical protein